jgi:hypothetical protein
MMPNVHEVIDSLRKDYTSNTTVAFSVCDDTHVMEVAADIGIEKRRLTPSVLRKVLEWVHSNQDEGINGECIAYALKRVLREANDPLFAELGSEDLMLTVRVAYRFLTHGGHLDQQVVREGLGISDSRWAALRMTLGMLLDRTGVGR